MRILKLQEGDGQRLCLILNGWSASPELFRSLPLPAGADCWVAYDYRSLSFPERLEPFQEIHLIAWSLGVWVATTLWSNASPFTFTTAINGTPFPIHTDWGIPPEIFEGTLRHLDEEGLKRFDRRMCGDRATLQRYQLLPSLPQEVKAAELQALHQAIQATPVDSEAATRFWDRALVSRADRIFPTAAQQAYWQGRIPVETLEGPHLPFYQPEITALLWK